MTTAEKFDRIDALLEGTHPFLSIGQTSAGFDACARCGAPYDWPNHPFFWMPEVNRIADE